MATAPALQDNSPVIGNAEAEALLCGALMVTNSLIDSIADNLSADDFSDPFFGHLFGLIVREHSLGRSPNPITLKPYVDASGYSALCDLTGNMASRSGATSVAAKGAAEQIRNLGRSRRLVEGLREAIAAASEKPLAEAASIAEDAIAASADIDAGKSLTAAECVSRVIDGLNDNKPGIRSGIGSLDATMGEIRKSDLTILGGRPGMGKSAVASSYALGAASRGHGTLFVSLEMNLEALGERMIADLCFDSSIQIPYGAITAKRVSAEQGREMARAADRIRDLPLVLEHSGGMTVGKIGRLVKKHKRRMEARGQKLELVIVDYLQLANPDHREKDLYTRVTEVSKGLKALAINHDVGVLALCQLSRKVEDRADKRPQMADLRDSGQIEQDADAICFLYAPEYYLLQCEPKDPAKRLEWEQAIEEDKGKIEFIVPKQRRGPGGVGHGRFYRAFQAVRG